MGDQLYLERFVWFDNETRHGRFPNASGLGQHFEIAPKTAQRSIDHFRDRLQAPLEYDLSRKDYCYTNPTFQLPVTCNSETRWHLGSLTDPGHHDRGLNRSSGHRRQNLRQSVCIQIQAATKTLVCLSMETEI